MPSREPETLTRLELQIMQVIWRLGSANVSAVQAELAQPLAYTTVQTMLNILHRKGKLRRKLQGRAYVYSATVTESKATGHAVRDLVDRVFGGSTEALLMSMLDARQISPEELARVAKKVKKDRE
jgi:BlaI family transcriptional regulator, penicillinase repressor